MVVLLLLASCYQPTVQTGLPCSENGTCPAGQSCDRGVCQAMPGTGDASPIDAAPNDADAAIDAPPQPLAWTETTPLPSPRILLCVAAFGNRLYASGGFVAPTPKSEVVTAEIQSDGTLGAWTAVTQLPFANRWHGCAVDPTNPSLYIVGGSNGTTAKAEVLRATIDPVTGALGPWVPQVSLPAGRRGGGVVWTAGTLYVIMGEEADGFVLRDTVYRATTTASGIPGGWTTQAALAPVDYVFGTAVAGGRIYKTGGYNDNTIVRVSTIGTSAALGTYATTTPLPGPRQRHVSTSDGTYVYVLGGEISLGGTNLNSALRSAIGPTGSLGAWTSLPTMPAAIAYGDGVMVNGRIYILGGSDGVGPSGTNETARVFILSGL